MQSHRFPKAATFLILALFVFHTEAARGTWRAFGGVKKVTRRSDGVELTTIDGARVSLIQVSTNVLRVRIAPSGKFEADHSYAVIEDSRANPAVMTKETSKDLIISTAGGLRVLVQKQPFLLTIYDSEGHELVAEDAASPAAFDPDTGAVRSSNKRVPSEVYYGFGEKALPMSREGEMMAMWNTDTYGYPRGTDPIYEDIGFFIALKRGSAYGLFLDNTYRSYFDMGKTSPDRYTFGAAGGELNYYVFAGSTQHTPAEVLREYTELTGRFPLPPLWALGYQQSRWSYYPEARVRELARRFRAEHIPADVIYLDIDYMDGYRVFTWDKSRFPDPERMIHDLRADGFRVVVIVDPGIKVDQNYEVYRQGKEKNYYCKSPDGSEYHANVWPGACAFPDFTDPAARAWFGSLYGGFLQEGVSGFWNDMDEPATFLPDESPDPALVHDERRTFRLDVRHAGDGVPGDHSRYHNVFGMQMARATYEGVRKLKPEARPLVITRAGYAGVQRYSAVWTGDNVANWDHLALSISMLTNFGVSGVPFVGADVGGFSGEPSAELYTRWLQAAALTPFLRSHTENNTREQDPFSYGPEYLRINRASIELRYRLLPYIYTLFHEHEESGAPVMRPVWFNYPKDVKTYELQDQYMLGSDLLVAPVVTEGAIKRDVYFPKGDTWVDWWSGKKYEGGTKVNVEAPLDKLPLFARAGAIIPVQPVIQNTGEMAAAPLSFAVIMGSDGSGSVYEDAGDGYENRAGSFRVILVSQKQGTINIAQRGAYELQRQPGDLEFLGTAAPPAEVRIGNRLAPSGAFDQERNRFYVALRKEDFVKEVK